MNLANPQQSTPMFAAAEQFLVRIDALIDWAALVPAMEAASESRQTLLPLSAVKIALLKRWYGIADSQAAFAMLDRLSFRSFLGFMGDAGAGDAAILSELDSASWSREPAMDALVESVEQQLRSSGYTVRAGQQCEPSIAPCTETVEVAAQVDSTALFRPGELGRMVEAVTQKAHAEGRVPSGAPAES